MHLLSLLLLLDTAHAATLTVATDGSGGYTDIQDAINDAVSGDIVLVLPGTYRGALDFGGKDISLQSTGGPTVTTIDGNGESSFAITFRRGETRAALVDGFTLDNTTRYGAIRTADSSPTLSNLVISGFSSSSNSAVYVNGGGPLLRNITFSGNSSTSRGGHLLIEEPDGIEVEECAFDTGVAASGGGAVYIDGDSSTSIATFTRCTFDGDSPGEIVATGVLLYTDTCTFSGNGYIALSYCGDGLTYSDFGSTWENNARAAYFRCFTDDPYVLDGSSFLNNSDSETGLSAPVVASDTDGTLVIRNAQFVGNDGSIGALRLDEIDGIISDTTFTDNTGRGYSGAINSDASLILDDCTVSGNEGHTAGAVGFWVLSASGSTFTGNFSEHNGGALSTSSHGGLTLDGCTFSDNVADDLGGAIYAGHYYYSTDAVSITDSVFISNFAYATGAAYLSSTTIDIVDSTFENNTSESSTGALFGYGIVTLSGSRFSANSAVTYGVGHLDADDGSRIDDCVFNDNVASGSVGALLVNFSGVDTPFVVANSSFLRNLAASDDGALNVNGGYSAEINDCRFEANQAGGRGGAITINTGRSLGFRRNLLCENVSGTQGGGLFFYRRSSRPEVALAGNIFSANQAPSGSAAYFDATSTALSIWNNDFLGGTAGSTSGALYLDGVASAVIENNIFAWESRGAAIAGDSTSASGAQVWFNDFHENANGDGISPFGPTYAGTLDNIDSEPDFVSYTGSCDDMLALLPTSALIDAGDPSVEDPDDTRSDIGAYGGRTPYAEDSDGDGWYTRIDCDDTDADVHPDAMETCNGIDDDCDGVVDETGATGKSTWYRDSDGDGYGDATVTSWGCSPSEGYTDNATDCDDRDRLVHPGARESCDDFDNDCDEEVDEAGASGEATWYPDDDGDGYTSREGSIRACNRPRGYNRASDAWDCDDANADIHPEAKDLPDNGIDEDCDGNDASTGGPMDTSDTGGPGTDDPSKKKEASTCGCAAEGTSAWGGLWLLGLVAMLVRRRQ